MNIRWAADVAYIEELRNSYILKCVVENPEGKIPISELGVEKKTQLKLIMKENECEDMDRVKLAQDTQ
jgi:hypothetical protein